MGAALVASQRPAVWFRRPPGVRHRRAGRQRRPHHPLVARTGGINAMLVDNAADQWLTLWTWQHRSTVRRCSFLRLLLRRDQQNPSSR
jgi:delta 1-pyrroline-5-carboxylate dehydrogenase